LPQQRGTIVPALHNFCGGGIEGTSKSVTAMVMPREKMVICLNDGDPCAVFEDIPNFAIGAAMRPQFWVRSESAIAVTATIGRISVEIQSDWFTCQQREKSAAVLGRSARGPTVPGAPNHILTP
jgi:hypothetical protein